MRSKQAIFLFLIMIIGSCSADFEGQGDINVTGGKWDRGISLRSEEGEMTFVTLPLDTDKNSDYFLNFELDLQLDTGHFEVQVRDNGELLNEVRLTESNRSCWREWLTFRTSQSSEIQLRVLMDKYSAGAAQLNQLQLWEEKHEFDKNLDFYESLSTVIGFSEITNTDADVDSMATYINRMLRSPQMFDIDYPEGSFIQRFVTDRELEGNAYCHRSSLSLDNMLKQYGFKVRQLHWEDSTCNGFHQFLEYFDESSLSWKVIDPYYGVRYVDNGNEYIGWEKIKKMVYSGDFSLKNVKRLNIEAPPHLYNKDEIIKGWNSDFKLYVMDPPK